MLKTLPLALGALLSSPAMAATTTGYVTNVYLTNSSYSSTYACNFVLASSATATSGTRYYVDDVTFEHDATCSAVMAAMHFNDDITVEYDSSSTYRYVTGISSTESGGITAFSTHNLTGTDLADHCKATLTSSSGTTSLYVDDDNPEEHVLCSALALAHFYGASASSLYTYAPSNEIMYMSFSW